MALTVKIRGDATHFEKTMAKVNGTVGGVTKSMAGLTLKTAAFGAALVGIGGGLALVNKSFDAIKDASEKAAGMESLQLSFEVLTGSADKAKSMIAAFRDEAAKSPLSTNDYAQAGKTLMAFGSEADKALPTLKMLGDVSMGNADRFASLALAFAQTQAAGRLMGQEVLQFVNAGFNPLQQISKKTGESMAVLKKRMEDGAISADMVTEAFRDATSKGGLFFGAIQRGAETTEGKIAKFKDTILSLKIAFGTGFNEGLKSALDTVGASLPQFEAKFAEIGKSMGLAIARAAEGDFAIFTKVGVVIGEAIKAGLTATIGGTVNNSILRPLIDKFDSFKGEKEKMGLPSMADNILGPQMSASEMVSGSASLAMAIESLRSEFEGGQEFQRKSDEKAREQREDTRRAIDRQTEAILKQKPMTTR